MDRGTNPLAAAIWRGNRGALRGFRLGSALILLGVITLAVFLVTLTVDQGDPWTLVAGSALSAVGLYLRRRNAQATRDGPELLDVANRGQEEE